MDSAEIELNLAGDIVQARIINNIPEILREGQWQPVVRLQLKCGRSLTADDILQAVSHKLKKMGRS